MVMTVALAICRLVRDASALLLWGSGVYLAVLVPRSLRAPLLGSVMPLHRRAGLAIVLALAVQLPLEAAHLGDGWRAAFDPATLEGLLFGTTIGTAWLVQAGFAVLLLFALTRSRWIGLVLLTTAALLAGTTFSGHAAAREGWLGGLQRINAVVHLLAGGFWFGALVPLIGTLAVLASPAWPGSPADHAAAALGLRRFSRVGHGAVAAVIASGVANTAFVLGRWPTAWSSPYQILLAIKIALVAAMTGLAVFNRYRLVPHLRRNREAAFRALKRATVVEVVLGVAVIACVAIFGLLDPS